MITVVTASGGRCGTSLCMQMLRAAGVPVFSNRVPNVSVINPRGHYEVDWRLWPVRRGEWMRAAEGHAVKLFWYQIQGGGGLPVTHDYQFIELRRDHQNMFDSQTVMFTEENRLAERNDPRRTLDGIRRGQDDLSRWLIGRRVLTVNFAQLQSGTACEPIQAFLNLPASSISAMSRCIDPTLWHFHPEAR